jgi:hypothetical protein
MLSSYKTFNLLIIGLLIFSNAFSQLPLYNGVTASDTGFSNDIGNANSSRNIAVSNDGVIYVVYTGSSGIRVSKSVNRGQSFLPSVSISAFNAEPEIIVNDTPVSSSVVASSLPPHECCYAVTHCWSPCQSLSESPLC